VCPGSCKYNHKRDLRFDQKESENLANLVVHLLGGLGAGYEPGGKGGWFYRPPPLHVVGPVQVQPNRPLQGGAGSDL